MDNCLVFEPTHLNFFSQIGSFPQGLGWKLKTYLKPPSIFNEQEVAPSGDLHLWPFFGMVSKNVQFKGHFLTKNWITR